MELGSSKFDKQSRAKRLFSEMPIKKSIWIVCIPGLLTYFFVGLYSFLDQVLIQILVPQVRTISDVYSGHYSNFNLYSELANYFSLNGISWIPNVLPNGLPAGIDNPAPSDYFSSNVLKYFNDPTKPFDINTSPYIPITQDLFTGVIGSGIPLHQKGVQNSIDIIIRSLDNMYNHAGNFNENSSSFAELSSVSVIARQAVNSFGPVTYIGNAIVFLIPLGASVYYTKSISYKYEQTGRDIWATGFWTSIVLCLFGSLICLIMTGADFQRTMVGTVPIDNEVDLSITPNIAGPGGISSITQAQSAAYIGAISLYTNKLADISADWGRQFSYLYSSALVITGTYSLLSYFIRAEGRNIYVTYWAVIANVLNVLFDWILIQYADLGSLGSALATFIGWNVNLIAYIGYVIYHNRRNSTWMSFGRLIKFKFNFKIIFPIIALGSSSFFRVIGLAISVIVYNQLLVNLGHQDFQNYHAAALPIVFLFFYALFGISDGGRPVIAYNYTQRNLVRVKQTFWWVLLVSLCYAAIAFIIVCSIAEPVLTIFHFGIVGQPDSAGGTFGTADNIYNGANYLRSIMSRTLFFSIALCGMTLFQGTNNISRSVISSMMEGFFIAYITFGVFYGIAQAVGPADGNLQTWIYVCSYGLSTLFAGLIIFAMSIDFLYRNLSPEYMKKHPKRSKLQMVEFNFFVAAAKREGLPSPAEIQAQGLAKTEEKLKQEKAINQEEENLASKVASGS